MQAHNTATPEPHDERERAILDQFYRAHRCSLVAFANRLDNGYGEDHVQELWVRMLRLCFVARYCESDLIRIAFAALRNLIIDELRGRSRRPTDSIDWLLESGWEPIGPSDIATDAIARIDVDRHLAQLSAEVQNYMRCILEGASIDEANARFGYDRSAGFRLRKGLRDDFDDLA